MPYQVSPLTQTKVTASWDGNVPFAVPPFKVCAWPCPPFAANPVLSIVIFPAVVLMITTVCPAKFAPKGKPIVVELASPSNIIPICPTSNSTMADVSGLPEAAGASTKALGALRVAVFAKSTSPENVPPSAPIAPISPNVWTAVLPSISVPSTLRKSLSATLALAPKYSPLAIPMVPPPPPPAIDVPLVS